MCNWSRINVTYSNIHISRLILYVLFVATILVSCSGNDPEPASTRRWSGTLFRNAIGTPVSPSDQIIAETNYVNEIKNVIAECMQERGFQFFVQHSDPNDDIDTTGIELSRERFAMEFGFAISRSAVANQASSTRHNNELERHRDYLVSLPPEELKAYEIALTGDPLSDSSGEESSGIEGCDAKARSSVELPSWFTYHDWLNEVAIELDRRVKEDQRFKMFDQQWADCMSEIGYDEWSSERELADSLSNEFVDLLQRLEEEQSKSDPYSTVNLATLDSHSAARYDDFAAREVELAVVSYSCVAEYEHAENQVYDELERVILESNPPPN